MEPVIPTSFIPKRPIEQGVAAMPEHAKRSMGLLSFLIFLAIIGVGGSYAFTYIYTQNLVRQKSNLESELVDARNGIGTTFVTDMKTLDNRISGIKELLNNHIVVTPIFEALEATTLRSVQYSKFSYTFVKDTGAGTPAHVTVELDGTAKTYSTLALQSDAFQGSGIIKNPVFSELTVDDKTHNVNFKLTFDVDANALSYESFIANLQGTAVSPTAPATTTTSTTALPVTTTSTAAGISNATSTSQ